MQEKRYAFAAPRDFALAVCFILPQLVVTGLFFFYPAGQAVLGSFFMEDAFGLSKEFVGLENYRRLAESGEYLHSAWVSLVFSLSTVLLSMGLALVLAVTADQAIKGGKFYKSAVIIPYAVAPPLAGVLWMFLFNPSGGAMTRILAGLGVSWNHMLDGDQAMILIIIAASWKQISYNFLFFLAGLQAIPKSLIEAAAIDGAGFWRRFLGIVFPLLSPTTFFLLVVNTIYTLFETFGIVHAVTSGGPAQATSTLIYKVYNDGFVGLDFGGSSAQSVVLMIIVMALTFAQFHFVEKKVAYQ
ncbi:MAG: sn-glycerol-3-phosphate ABC transporter permease UgpA [Candidatus Accumulibacter sp.]|jgi:sn-glycerol 3-phosphate transport system permease protein|nr:sn-glycerol-3-phosphate ABC transporter permease UgpA [Accumulibacter sp.]